jgi:hypothetical protein
MLSTLFLTFFVVFLQHLLLSLPVLLQYVINYTVLLVLCQQLFCCISTTILKPGAGYRD